MKRMSWRDKWTQVLAQTVSTDTDKDALAIFPDQDTPITLTVSWSQAEYTRILSALTVGAEFTNPDISMQIFYDFLKLTEGGLPVSCETVAECLEEIASIEALQNIITTNQTIINAITETVNNSGFGNPNNINPYVTTIPDKNPSGFINEQIKDLPNCDLNKLWAGIRSGIVLYLNDTAKDVLEDLTAIPNVLERLSVFIDVIPVMGDLAEGLAFQITEIIPDLLNLYTSHESETVLDEIACDIFSAVCSDCRYPTFQEVFNVYASGSLGTPSMSDLTLDVIANFLLDLIANPASIAFHTISVWALFVLNAQAAFNGKNGTNTIVNWATIGEDSASDNWTQLCDGCGDEYMLWTWDFKTQGIGEFYPDTTNTTSKAIFEPGKGWRCVNHSTGRRFDVCMPFEPTWQVRAVAMHITGTADTGYTWARRPTWGSTTGQQNASAGGSNATWTHFWEGYASVTGINEVDFFAQFAAGAAAWLDKVSILFNRSHSPGDVVPTSDLTPYS